MVTRHLTLFVEGFRSTFRWRTVIGAAIIGIVAAMLNLSGAAILLALAALLYGACYCADRSGSV